MNAQAQIAMYAAVLSAIIVLGVKRLDRLRERRAAALALHEAYVSPTFYQKVRAPLTRLRRRWAARDVGADAFRSLVASGWDRDWVLTDPVDDGVAADLESERARHFRAFVPDEGLTEHQALTVMVRFWARLGVQLECDVVSRKLVRSLFADEWSYLSEMLLGLAAMVEERRAGAPLRWPANIRYVDGFFRAGALDGRWWWLDEVVRRRTLRAAAVARNDRSAGQSSGDLGVGHGEGSSSTVDGATSRETRSATVVAALRTRV